MFVLFLYETVESLEKYVLSAEERGKRLKEKHHNSKRSVFPLTFVLGP
jgi:hypothetical protein